LKRRSVIAGLGTLGLGSFARLPPLAAAPTERAVNLSALEERHGGRIGLSASSGARRVHWRGTQRFAYCSTFKLFLAAATLERVQQGAERLDRAVPVTQKDMISHAPVTGPAVGASLTVAQLCQATVEVSDNPAANILIREMGGLDAWGGWYRSIGDDVTRVDRWELELNSAIPGDPRDTTTPQQTVTNLASVLLGDRLSSAHRQLLEGWLVASPTGSGRIRAGVPAGWRVGHKTGTGKTPVNDIGIIRPPTGAPVLIALYFTEAKRGSLEEREAILAEATRRALQALA
jgi:beta-lactamase class A